MVNSETGKDWICVKTFHDAIRSAKEEGNVSKEKAKKLRRDCLDERDIDDKGSCDALIQQAVQKAKEDGVVADVEYIQNYAKAKGFDSLDLDESIVGHALLKENNGKDLQKELTKLVKNKINLGIDVIKERRKIFAEFAEIIKNETFNDSLPIIGFCNYVQTLTGKNMIGMVERLEACIGNAIYTQEQVIEWVDDYVKINGKYPTCNIKTIIQGTNINWEHINDYFTRGACGLIGFDSLADFLKKECGKNYTIEQVKQRVEDFVKINGKYPSTHDEEIIPGTISYWNNIDNYFRVGSRGLVGYESLLDFLEKQCGKIDICYTIDQVKQWVKDYVKLKGTFPSDGNKEIIFGTNICWYHISNYFRRQSRGLVGYKSFTEFLQKEFIYKPKIVTKNTYSGEYTVDQLKQWVVDFVNKNGKYPASSNKEIIPGTNIHWRYINHYFARQSKGLIGYFSLKDFLEKECGKKELTQKHLIDFCIENSIYSEPQWLKKRNKIVNPNILKNIQKCMLKLNITLKDFFIKVKQQLKEK